MTSSARCPIEFNIDTRVKNPRLAGTSPRLKSIGTHTMLNRSLAPKIQKKILLFSAHIPIWEGKILTERRFLLDKISKRDAFKTKIRKVWLIKYLKMTPT